MKTWKPSLAIVLFFTLVFIQTGIAQNYNITSNKNIVNKTETYKAAKIVCATYFGNFEVYDTTSFYDIDGVRSADVYVFNKNEKWVSLKSALRDSISIYRRLLNDNIDSLRLIYSLNLKPDEEQEKIQDYRKKIDKYIFLSTRPNDFITVYTSASQNHSPVFEYREGLPENYVMDYDIKKILAERDNEKTNALKFYYFGVTGIWGASEDRLDKLINVLNTSVQFNKEELNKVSFNNRVPIESQLETLRKEWANVTNLTEKDLLNINSLKGLRKTTATSYTIPNVPYFRQSDWVNILPAQNSCVVMAGASLLSFYDNKGYWNITPFAWYEGPPTNNKAGFGFYQGTDQTVSLTYWGTRKVNFGPETLLYNFAVDIGYDFQNGYTQTGWIGPLTLDDLFSRYTNNRLALNFDYDFDALSTGHFYSTIKSNLDANKPVVLVVTNYSTSNSGGPYTKIGGHAVTIVAYDVNNTVGGDPIGVYINSTNAYSTVWWNYAQIRSDNFEQTLVTTANGNPGGFINAPSCISPQSGSSVNSGNITLSWQNVSATEYRVQISKSSTYSSYEYDLVTTSTSVTKNFTSSGTYYWRVVPKNSSGNWCHFSNDYTFTIIPPIVDNPPSVSSFSISSSSIVLGNSFSLSYSVNDDVGLSRVELWRTTDISNWGNTAFKTTTLTGQKSYSNSFTDTPPSSGTYWYGLHVVDTKGQLTVEPSPPGPLKGTVTTANQTVQITITTNPTGRTYTVDGTSYSSQQTFQWNAGSNHIIATTATQSGGSGTQYLWSNWSDGSAISHTITVPSTASTYTANFITQYYLTLTPNPTNSGSLNLSSNWYTSGDILEIKASPYTGFAFSSWSGDVSSTNNPVQLTMNRSKNVTANFTQIPPTQYSLTVSASNGTVTKNPDQSSYTSGTTVQLTATPNNGYTFSGWSGDASGTNNPLQVTMNSNKSIIANFTAIPPTQYSLTVSASNGTVTKNPDQSSYTSGTTVQLTATPNNGYTFSGWSGDASGTNNPLQVTMNSNKNITANFTAIPPTQYSLTVSASNGTVTKNPDQASYSSGTTVQLTATPNNGYTFSGWSGDASGTNNPLQVTMNSNKNITANFTAIPPTQYSLTVSASNGTVTKNPDQSSYSSGTAVQLTATPNNGYSFSAWSGSGGSFSSTTSSTTTFTITGNANVTAGFISANSKPEISVSVESLDFGSVIIGKSSIPKTYTISGENIVENLEIQATEGYVISFDINNFYSKILEIRPLPGLEGNVSATIYVKFVPTQAGAQTGTISHISTGANARKIVTNGIGIFSPTITLSTTALPNFGELLVGSYSAPQTYTVSGIFLSSDISIAAPGWFQISKDSNSGFVNSLSLSQINSTVSKTTIYVRYVSTAIGTQNANIPHGSNGAETQYLFVQGKGSQTCSAVNINLQPQGQTVQSGKTATFSIMVSGTGPFSYTWFKNDVPVFNESNTTITSSMYTTPQLTNENKNDFYYCKVTNCNNSFETKSSSAYLTLITDIEDKVAEMPKTYILHQNYPNPFNPSTNIKYEIAKDSHIKIVVRDLLGRELNVLVDKYMNRGVYEITFNAEDLSTGVYFYQLKAGAFVATKKLIIMK